MHPDTCRVADYHFFPSVEVLMLLLFDWGMGTLRQEGWHSE
jgi:hypothetical protein